MDIVETLEHKYTEQINLLMERNNRLQEVIKIVILTSKLKS